MAVNARQIQEQFPINVDPHIIIAGEIEHHGLLPVLAGQPSLRLEEVHLHLHAKVEVRFHIVVQGIQSIQRNLVEIIFVIIWIWKFTAPIEVVLQSALSSPVIAPAVLLRIVHKLPKHLSQLGIFLSLPLLVKVVGLQH